MGVQLKIVEARTPEEFARGFARLSEHAAQGVVLLADPSIIEHRALISELARIARLPTAFQRRENVEAGGLLGYGADNNDQFRQAAFYVDQILKGAKPADLPVQRARRESQNRQGARTGGSPAAARPRRRGDRIIELSLLHLLRSGIGTVLTKPDLALCPQLARADIRPVDGNSGCDPSLDP